MSIAIAEQPHYHCHFAAMVWFIYLYKPDAAPPTEDDGKIIIKTLIGELLKAFQGKVDIKAWRESRLFAQFFTHLATLPRPLIDLNSLYNLLFSFSQVLEDPFLRGVRGDAAARLIALCLLRLPLPAPADLVSKLKAYLASPTREWRNNVVAAWSEDLGFGFEGIDDIAELVNALEGETETESWWLDFGMEVPMEDEEEKPVEIPSLLVPPEDEDTAGKGYEHVGIGWRGLGDESVVPHNTARGATLRQIVRDVMDIYECNRKECSKVLLSLPSAYASTAFGPKGVEPLIVETIASALLTQPAPPHRPIYYTSLLAQLCLSAPATVAPALGKRIRYLYSILGTAGNAGVVVRLADWLSTHLSNFNFLWVWGEWQGDTELEDGHPKKVFLKRVLELETRLSYHQRILESVPSSYVENGVMPRDPPATNWPEEGQFEDLLALIRGKKAIPDLEQYLSDYAADLERKLEASDEEAGTKKLELAVRALLTVGSRSFSHFLNVLERYLQLLRDLTPTPSSRLIAIETVSSFYSHNSQFALIVLDKFLQYRVVDTIDVIRWVFISPAVDWADIVRWDVLKGTVEKVNGRVESMKKRVEALRKEETEKRDRERAGLGGGGGGEEDAPMDVAGGADGEPSPELSAAMEQLTNAREEQSSIFAEVVKSFSDILTTSEDEGWNTWWLKGWWKYFCLQFADQLAECQDAIGSVDIQEGSWTKEVMDLTKGWGEFAGRG
ncbi:hypothetical protein BT69DRAFT_7752 [Atractiella rhizophila]|nr:hypothetical protein BT69DRAFT_7752 [Atractiella rhizophila]